MRGGRIGQRRGEVGKWFVSRQALWALCRGPVGILWRPSALRPRERAARVGHVIMRNLCYNFFFESRPPSKHALTPLQSTRFLQGVYRAPTDHPQSTTERRPPSNSHARSNPLKAKTRNTPFPWKSCGKAWG